MKIPFDKHLRKKFYALLDEVFDSHFWSEGVQIKKFEDKFSRLSQLNCAAVSSGGAALRVLLEYVGVKGGDVLAPVNTFWATHLAVIQAGGRPMFVDCNREDLCLSLDDLKKRLTAKTKAVVVAHIGGHIAFEIEAIADFCRIKGLPLIEDCAHAHGAEYKKKAAGSWGVGGAYSFYATKTMPLGEGGMVVSSDRELIEKAKCYRNYGKSISEGRVVYPIKNGFNYRMDEFTAALGIVQLENLGKILDWKRRLADKYENLFSQYVKMPVGMVSGFYKFIVFDTPLKVETGKIFRLSDSAPVILGQSLDHPNFEWVAQHHGCPPIYYGYEDADLPVKELRRRLLVN